MDSNGWQTVPKRSEQRSSPSPDTSCALGSRLRGGWFGCRDRLNDEAMSDVRGVQHSEPRCILCPTSSFVGERLPRVHASLGPSAKQTILGAHVACSILPRPTDTDQQRPVSSSRKRYAGLRAASPAGSRGASVHGVQAPRLFQVCQLQGNSLYHGSVARMCRNSWSRYGCVCAQLSPLGSWGTDGVASQAQPQLDIAVWPR